MTIRVPFLRPRAFPLGLAACLLALGLLGCDGLSNEVAPETTEVAQLAEAVAQDLQLSAPATNTLRDSFDRHRDRFPEPGFLWHVTADLQASLSEEQKQRLLDRPVFPLSALHGGLRPGPGFRQDPPLAHLADELELTDAQLEELEALRAAYKPQIQALLDMRKEGSLDPDDFRAQLEALHEEMRAAMDALLTDAQRTKLAALRAEAETQRGAAREAERAAMIEVLALTEAQRADLAALHAQWEAEREALREAFVNGEIDREMLAESFAAFDAALADILTPTQLEIVQIHRALLARLQRRMLARRGGPPGGGPGNG